MSGRLNPSGLGRFLCSDATARLVNPPQRFTNRAASHLRSRANHCEGRLGIVVILSPLRWQLENPRVFITYSAARPLSTAHVAAPGCPVKLVDLPLVHSWFTWPACMTMVPPGAWI